VLVVMQLVSAFTENLTWSGLLVLLGLFVVIWLSWMGFTLYANRFDTDDVVFRVSQLSATPGHRRLCGERLRCGRGIRGAVRGLLPGRSADPARAVPARPAACRRRPSDDQCLPPDLFVIPVLGETLGGVVRGVHDASWSGPAVPASLIGFVVIAALW
jgi:Bacterial low temperature requirement A protein (LtrA)